MYNVKIYKYPTGWQIRTYDRPVGFCDDSGEFHFALASDYVLDDGEYVQVRFNPAKQCVEPFTEQLATKIFEPHERDMERSSISSMNRTKNKVYHLARSNLWEWFFTLTFDPEKVDSFNYEECVKKLKQWLDYVRRSCPDMKYLIVPEKHKSGRVHFHGLFADCDGLGFSESGHFTKDGQPIYNIGRYRLGWSTATKVHDNERVTKYISKYITKELCMVAFGKKRYWASRNLSECETEEYILDAVELQAYIEKLSASCSWCKTVDVCEVKTTYFEMGMENG